MKTYIFIILVSSLFFLGQAIVAEDEITALPGWNATLPSKMYSGFIPAGVDVQDNVTYSHFEHYFFVESENNPATDPVIVWTNGGPGAASFFGLFTELGPLYLSEESQKTDAFNKTGVPTFFRNEHSWTKNASILIINSPPPIGYSYCTHEGTNSGQTGDGGSCGTHNDTRTAKGSAQYLENWAIAWPEYQTQDWYIIGESYAGIYVPTLVREIISNETSIVNRQLKGFSVGDGCLGSDDLCGTAPMGPGPFWDIKFMYGHGQISNTLYFQLMNETNCPKEQLVGYNVSVTAPECMKLLTEMERQLGGYFVYNLYDTCWYQNDFSPPTVTDMARFGKAHLHSGASSKLDESPFNNGYLDYPCNGAQMVYKWIIQPTVRAALHVAADAHFLSGDNGDIPNFTYNMTEPSILPFYQQIHAMNMNATERTLRMLIYNGDTDVVLNTFSAQNWTTSLNFTESEGGWRPWTIDGKEYMGGYVTRYDGDFDFVTIRGSGHMVPQNKPMVSWHLMNQWLNKENWLPYVAPPTPQGQEGRYGRSRYRKGL